MHGEMLIRYSCSKLHCLENAHNRIRILRYLRGVDTRLPQHNLPLMWNTLGKIINTKGFLLKKYESTGIGSYLKHARLFVEAYVHFSFKIGGSANLLAHHVLR